MQIGKELTWVVCTFHLYREYITFPSSTSDDCRLVDVLNKRYEQNKIHSMVYHTLQKSSLYNSFSSDNTSTVSLDFSLSQIVPLKKGRLFPLSHFSFMYEHYSHRGGSYHLIRETSFEFNNWINKNHSHSFILCAYTRSGILGDLILCEGTFQIVGNLTYYMNWIRLSQGWNLIIVCVRLTNDFRVRLGL